MQAEYVFEKGQMKLDQDLENQARYPYLEFQDTHLPSLRYQRAVLQ